VVDLEEPHDNDIIPITEIQRFRGGDVFYPAPGTYPRTSEN